MGIFINVYYFAWFTVVIGIQNGQKRHVTKTYEKDLENSTEYSYTVVISIIEAQRKPCQFQSKNLVVCEKQQLLLLYSSPPFKLCIKFYLIF